MRLFQQQLQELFQKVVVMGTTAEAMIGLAFRGLLDRTEKWVPEVYAREQEVNALQVEIDDRAVRLAALQQPVATDVRFIFMASRICTELERIADQAINIAQNSHFVLAAPPLKPMVDLPIMADIAQKMVRDSLSAMVDRDVARAERVLLEEEKVDALRNQIFRELLTYMMADPTTIQRALSLILVSRNLERIGDHSTNIAEEVIYWIQGRDVRHTRPHESPDDAAATSTAGAGVAAADSPGHTSGDEPEASRAFGNGMPRS